MLINVLSTILLIGGCFFFFAGMLGLLRFPDLYSRVHALTKADNIGLGMVCLALMLQARLSIMSAKIAVVWMLVVIASAASCSLILNYARQHGIRPWTNE